MKHRARPNPVERGVLWAMGGVAVVIGGAAAWAFWPKAAAASPTTPTTPAIPTTPTTPVVTPPTPVSVTLTAGVAVRGSLISLPTVAPVSAAPGANVTVNLPPGAIANAFWASPLVANDTRSNLGSAPSAGNNPAAFTYLGGGSTLTASWVSADGQTQTSLVTVVNA